MRGEAHGCAAPGPYCWRQAAGGMYITHPYCWRFSHCAAHASSTQVMPTAVSHWGVPSTAGPQEAECLAPADVKQLRLRLAELLQAAMHLGVGGGAVHGRGGPCAPHLALPHTGAVGWTRLDGQLDGCGCLALAPGLGRASWLPASLPLSRHCIASACVSSHARQSCACWLPWLAWSAHGCASPLAP